MTIIIFMDHVADTFSGSLKIHFFTQARKFQNKKNEHSVTQLLKNRLVWHVELGSW